VELDSVWNCVFLMHKGFSGYIFGSPSWTFLVSTMGMNYAVPAQLEKSPALGTKGHVDST